MEEIEPVDDLDTHARKIEDIIKETDTCLRESSQETLDV